MAKFNEKVLCLFHKTHDQLRKEAERRGMPPDINREKAIAKIIWKDAYDAGVNEGKNAATATAHYLPANYYNVKPEVKEYCLHDIDNAVNYRLKLTEEQARVIIWMLDRGFITHINFSEFDSAFEDIGRI